MILISNFVNKPVRFYPDKEKEIYKYAQSFNFTAKVKEWLLADMQGRLYVQPSNNPIPVYVVNGFPNISPLPKIAHDQSEDVLDLQNSSPFPEIEAEEFSELDVTQFV